MNLKAAAAGAIMCLSAFSACAATPQKRAAPDAEAPKHVAILGDSYSTFEGYIPEGYIAWYKPVPPQGRVTDVTDVDQTWWRLLIEDCGYELETNNSYSGSTVCNTGYDGNDYSDRSFVNRIGLLGNPDIIFVFGGTNDAWANSPVGEYVWSGWTPEQLYSYRPAAAAMMSGLKELYPQAEIVVIINDDIKEDIQTSTAAIADHYGLKHIQLQDIDKLSGHPSVKGMRQIADQVEGVIHN